jgi:hypothetical protein
VRRVLPPTWQLLVTTDLPEPMRSSVVKVLESDSRELEMYARLDAVGDAALGVVPHVVVDDFFPGLAAVVMPELLPLEQLAVEPVPQHTLAHAFAQLLQVRWLCTQRGTTVLHIHAVFTLLASSGWWLVVAVVVGAGCWCAVLVTLDAGGAARV